MDCPICKSKKNAIVFPNFPGFIEGTEYKIFNCVKCDTQFISTEKLDKKIYDIIYSQTDTPGYNRYYKYAQEVKNHQDPLKFISKEESTYYPIYRILEKEKTRLKILEIGCGYGYLTYSLNSRGHQSIGIDISKKAIKYAQAHFGNNYYLASIDNYDADEKFDLIIATELIEHLPNPSEFISRCISLLKEDGKIILTTPNKDYAPKKSIWHTDLPPVHTVWLSKNSFKILAKQNKLNCEFVDFSQYVAHKENKLISYLLSRNNKLPLPRLNKNGKPLHKRIEFSNSFFGKVIISFVCWLPIKYSAHFFTKLFTHEHKILGIVMTKKMS